MEDIVYPSIIELIKNEVKYKYYENYINPDKVDISILLDIAIKLAYEKGYKYGMSDDQEKIEQLTNENSAYYDALHQIRDEYCFAKQIATEVLARFV